jgi:AraC-like DNA-binding protein
MQGPWIISGPLAAVELAVLGAPSGESKDYGTLPLRSFVASLERLAAFAAGDGAAVWRAGETLNLAHLGTVGAAMAVAPTLGAALRCFVTYFGTVQSSTSIGLEQEGDLVHLHYRILDETIWPRRADAELTLGIVASTVRRYAPHARRAITVQFEGPERGSDRGIETRLQRPVRRGDDNCLTIPARLMDAPLPRPATAREAGDFRDCLQQLSRNLSAMRALQPVSDRVRDLLLDQTGKGPTDQDSVARTLAMSRRTLRRKLEAEGTSFHELGEACRCSIGQALLTRTDLPIVEIAMRLGYSDHTAFSRAFSRWCGVPPRVLRKGLWGASDRI